MTDISRRIQHAFEPQEWSDKWYYRYRRAMPFSAIIMTLAIILISIPMIFVMFWKYTLAPMFRRRP